MTARRPEPNANGPVILTKNLCRDFGAIHAVSNLNLEVVRGELFGIVGPDGAGKTTTMRMLAGILEPTAGDAWVDGISVRDDPEGIKEHIAYMPQRFGLYADLTVMENLQFYADLFRVPKKERPARIARLFGFSRLGPFQDRLAGALSGGMKQKLGLACALIHEPRLLLLDEPTNGVDPVSRRDFWRILYDLLKEGISVLVTTAYLDEAERTHRVGLMHRGSMIRMGEPQALKDMVEGVMLELLTSDLYRTRTLVSGIPGVLDVNVFGDGLHVRIRNSSDADTIEEILRNNDIDVHSLKQISPAMEDAFLSLIPR
ncbi:MAG TPA: ABC transporter ATP-binding protein [Desulfomonilaceae bacterium]|nr:ABC transporter ATP-binding protein [Desulfomonilaceae bacterium]